MAWSQKAREAAALIRKARSKAQDKFHREGYTASAGLTTGAAYRKKLADTLRAGRKGKGPMNEAQGAAVKAVASTIARNQGRGKTPANVFGRYGYLAKLSQR